MEKWAEKFNLPLPECNKCGTCCICASPSKSYRELLQKAAEGDEFARNFLSIFIPYKNINSAEKVSASIVKRAINSAKEGKNNLSEKDLVFYHCRHYHFEKKCLIYENRPQLCRDFPGSPFVILNESCAFYNWAKECREKYKQLEKELEELKTSKKEIENLKLQQKFISLNQKLLNINAEYNFMLLNISEALISPGKSWVIYTESIK